MSEKLVTWDNIFKRLTLLAAASISTFVATVGQAQTYMQQSSGANSQNNIYISTTQTLGVGKLEPEIRSIIRTLEKEKSQRMRQIGRDLEEGHNDAALTHIHDALLETRDDATRLAFLHYAAGHALLLAGMYTNAAKQVDLAVGLSPENCRYRASDAMMLIAAGRPWDAETVVNPHNDFVQRCDAGGSDIDRALIHSVRAFVAANRRDESGTRHEMDAVDGILARMRPSNGLDDRYYEFQLNCTFAANAHQCWTTADQLWPDASSRCERWGRSLNTKMPGARDLAHMATITDVVKNGNADQTYSVLSEQIRSWSNSPAIPDLGIDTAGRLASLGSLYLARGMVDLWQLHRPAAAADDYRQAYDLLSTAATAGRPSAVAELGNLGFKIMHLEEVSNERVFPDSRGVFTDTTIRIADSSLTGDSNEACSALYWIAGLSRDLNSPATTQLQQKRSECEVSLQRDSIQQLTFTAKVAEQDMDFSTNRRDDEKVVSQLNVAIASRMKLRGFPKDDDNDSHLARELISRARYSLQDNHVDRALNDANLAVDIAATSENAGDRAAALSIKAFVLGAVGDKTAEALPLITQAKQIAYNDYTLPKNANISCFELFQYADTFATESQIQMHARSWKSAEAVLADMVEMLANQKSCGDLRFDGKNDDKALTPVKSMLLIRTIDAATSLAGVRLLEDETDESHKKAENLLAASVKSFNDAGFRDVAWPVTTYLRSTIGLH
ncbi:hypothetical protein PQQ84_00225 [Paraburkholderia strydomiana]|uniref:hypothetical protein n=1 Tax=Paraburkholderia strydomiana TaxID=1245417 RepID=UPI0038B8D809